MKKTYIKFLIKLPYPTYWTVSYSLFSVSYSVHCARGLIDSNSSHENCKNILFAKQLTFPDVFRPALISFNLIFHAVFAFQLGRLALQICRPLKRSVEMREIAARCIIARSFSHRMNQPTLSRIAEGTGIWSYRIFFLIPGNH